MKILNMKNLNKNKNWKIKKNIKLGKNENFEQKQKLKILKRKIEKIWKNEKVVGIR